jgi:hypothetical protein
MNASRLNWGLPVLIIVLGVISWSVIGGVVVVSVFAPTPTPPVLTLPPTVIATHVALLPSGTPSPSLIAAPTDSTDVPKDILGDAPTESPAPSFTFTATTLPTSAPPTSSAPLPGAITATPLIMPSDAPTTPAPPLTPETPATPEIIYLIVTNTPTEGVAPGTPATATPCVPPDGWVAYRVEEGDTLFGFQLGSNNTVDVVTIRQANCLSNNTLFVGQTVYLPPGAADAAPKIDNDDVPGSSRVANCPCTVRVRQGWRLEQIAALVNRLPLRFSGRDFLAVTSASASVPAEFGFLASRPPGKSLEGFMFPGDYTLDNTTTAEGFRDMLLRAFAANVTPDLQAALAGRGLTLWEAVNLASIVQRESYTPDEQQRIAGVFYNRMARDMGIASFATLQYALGIPGNWWPRITRGNINTETPYATHRYKGLPPTPISNPGLSALLAVAYPVQSDYLYFSAKCGGGGNFYARTFEEFQQGLKCP